MRRTVFPMSRLKIAAPGEDGRRRIEGYASVFGNRDSYGDIVVHGAFGRSLRERPDVKVLWQHDTRQPIGKQETAFENDFGLRVRGVLTDTPLVRDTVIPLMEDGVVNGLSIGYDPVEEDHADGSNLLRDVELFEWSPVTFPANERAQVTEVKSLDGAGDEASDRVLYTARKLLHELDIPSVRWDSLDSHPLVQLEAKLRGRLAGSSPKAADAEVIDEAIAMAYAAGVEDGAGLTKENVAA